MPARALPPPQDDAMAELAELLTAMAPAELEAFSAELPPADLRLLEQVLANRHAMGWRATPATLGHHCDPTFRADWRYVRLLATKFVEAIDGTDPRQLWNLPSQYGKTTLLCTYGVAWALQRNPKLRIMYVTYGDTKAIEEGGKARDVIEAHPELGVRLRRDRRARGMWRTDQGGGLYAVSITGGIVGWPADVVLLDDLLKGWAEAHSEATRDATWSKFTSQVRMRIQGRRCPIIAAGTRWHADDPSGRLLNPPDTPGAERYTHIRLPAVAEAHDPASHDTLLHDPDPIGRAPGEVLEPERFDAPEVQARAATLGSYLASALEQQRPSPEEGIELLRAWFKVELQVPTKPDRAITSWDLKLKDKEKGDYVVGQCWWGVGGGYWCMDQLRGQWDHATTANAIALLAVRHPEARQHVVEAAGSADEVLPKLRQAQVGYVVTDEMAARLGMNAAERAQLQALRRRGMSGLLAHPPKLDKRVRARVHIAPVAEAGDLHYPADAVWLPAYLDEMAAFPRGANDDQVDATSQALQRMARGAATASAPKGTVAPPTPGAHRTVNLPPAPSAGRARVSAPGITSLPRRRG